MRLCWTAALISFMVFIFKHVITVLLFCACDNSHADGVSLVKDQLINKNTLFGD